MNLLEHLISEQPETHYVTLLDYVCYVTENHFEANLKAFECSVIFGLKLFFRIKTKGLRKPISLT